MKKQRRVRTNAPLFIRSVIDFLSGIGIRERSPASVSPHAVRRDRDAADIVRYVDAGRVGEACGAALSDLGALVDDVAAFDGDRREVSVDSFETVAVFDDYRVARDVESSCPDDLALSDVLDSRAVSRVVLHAGLTVRRAAGRS